MAFQKWASQYGPVFKVFEGGELTVVIHDAILSRHVASRLSNRYPIPFLEVGEDAKSIDAGILFARDARHRRLRAAWQPMFHSQALSTAFQVMDAASNDVIDTIKANVDDQPVLEIWRFLREYTMKVAFKSAFGIDIAPHGSKDSLAEAATSFLKAAGHLEGPYVLMHVAFPPLAPLVRRIANLFPTPTYAAGLSGRRTIESTVSKLVMDRYACNVSASPPNLAQHLSITANDIQQKGYIKNDGDIVCQGSNFVIAAYETTSATLAFAIHLLSTHPAVQEVAIQEVDTLKTSHITDPKDVLNNCPFVVAVVKETLRLYPAVPLAIRQADKEMTLRSGKHSYFIPRGTHLAISIYGMHRDGSIWRDPDEFCPARFLPSSGANTTTTSTTSLGYMPFGDGVRCCIGEKYAMQECVIMLVKLLSTFRFENAESKGRPYGQRRDIETSMSLSLTPKNGVWVRVIPRKT